ncbi:hypothetical protein [Bifidobacterium olomucense]|uniref:Uncharacterized protein n=1 Tax=Bifidobacterium olomucense TaxID=2675324 RepID=A0A7Y0EXA4_9BIFI|nr:hypothetical protein [Bifidobacterium sp. DSM 109959]NMM98084.1 hypothetical protein [Bifidobacterium sp. DSM 109959]
MEYWSQPVYAGQDEWELTNISGQSLTVDEISSYDGVSLPFLVVKDGLHQTIADGKPLRVKFRATNIRNSFTGLILSGTNREGQAWTVQYPQVRS